MVNRTVQSFSGCNGACRGSCSGSCSCGNGPSGIITTRPAVTVFKGSTLTLNFLFPFVLTDLIVAVVEASDTNLLNPDIEYMDDYNVQMTWSSEQISNLKVGIKYKFRIGISTPDDVQNNFGNITLTVQ